MLFCAFDAYMETKFVAVMRVYFTRNVIGSVANQNGPSTFLRLYVSKAFSRCKGRHKSERRINL